MRVNKKKKRKYENHKLIYYLFIQNSDIGDDEQSIRELILYGDGEPHTLLQMLQKVSSDDALAKQVNSWYITQYAMALCRPHRQITDSEKKQIVLHLDSGQMNLNTKFYLTRAMSRVNYYEFFVFFSSASCLVFQ